MNNIERIFAEPTVVYDGTAHEFSFENIKNEDLFPDLKNVMPGDRILQKINLEVKNSYNAVFISLHADPLVDAEIWEEIDLNVYQGKERLEMGLEYPIGDLKQGVSLDDFISDKKVELYVEIDVPKDIGNEIADLREEIQWVFVAREYEGEDDSLILESAKVPQTGDVNQAMGYFFAGGVVLLGMILLLAWRKRKRL